jgi:hypothetical protein
VTGSAVMAHSILIEPTTIGDRGQRYRVTYLGNIIVESTRNPEFDACRALLTRGITGKLEMWRAGKTHPDVTLGHSSRLQPDNPRDGYGRSAIGALGDVLAGGGAGCRCFPPGQL